MNPVGSFHPKILTILDRLESLTKKDPIPIGASIEYLATEKLERVFDPTHSRIMHLKRALHKFNCDQGFFATLLAVAGKREATHVTQLISTSPYLDKSRFSNFRDYIKHQGAKLKTSQAALYAFCFRADVKKSSIFDIFCPYWSGKRSDEASSIKFSLAIIQCVFQEKVCYHVVDYGVEPEMRINRITAKDLTAPYTSDEFEKILEKIGVVVHFSQWGEKELNTWRDLGGTEHREWAGKNAVMPPMFGWSFSLLELDDIKFDPLESEIESLASNFSKISITQETPEGFCYGRVIFEKWPSSLCNLAWKSTTTEVAATVFYDLDKAIQEPQFLRHAAWYFLNEMGHTNGSRAMFTTKTSAASNCQLFQTALRSILVSDPLAEPERKSDKFSDTIKDLLNETEGQLLSQQGKKKEKAKLFLFESATPELIFGNKSDSRFGGHLFTLLQFLDRENKIRYLYLDCYHGQRQLLERLALRSPDDPSWGRKELDQFISQLCQLDKAKTWNEEFASIFYEAFGAFHPEHMGKQFPNTQQGLCFKTQVYPVDLQEVVDQKRCSKLRDEDLVEKVIPIEDHEFLRHVKTLSIADGKIAFFAQEKK